MWKLSATSARLPTTMPTPNSRKRNAVSTASGRTGCESSCGDEAMNVSDEAASTRRGQRTHSLAAA